MTVLQQIESQGRRLEYPILVCAVFAAIGILNYFVKGEPTIDFLFKKTQVTNQILTSVVLFVGVINLFIIHVRNVSSRRQNWPFSVYMLTIFVICLVAATIWGRTKGIVPGLLAIVSRQSSATQILLPFMFFSAMYRSFKIRNLETGMLILGSFVALFGQTQALMALVPWWLPISQWSFDWVVASTQNMMMVIFFLASAISMISILLGKERRIWGGSG